MSGWFERLVGGSVETSGTRRATPRRHGLGEAVLCGKVEVTVVSFGPRVVVGGPPVPEGHGLWVARVAVTNTAEQPVHCAEHAWRLFDVEDFAYEPLHHAGLHQEPRLFHGYLGPGDRAQGHLTFLLPTSAVPGRICFAQHDGVADFGVPREEEG